MDYHKKNAVSAMQQLIRQSKLLGKKAIELVSPLPTSKKEIQSFEKFIDGVFPSVRAIKNSVGSDNRFHTIFEL